MIQNISSNTTAISANNIAQPLQNSNNDIANTQSDSSNKMQSSSEPDTHNNKIQDIINPEYAKYLGVVVFSDGRSSNFPSDNAPLAAQKAWDEAVNKVTSAGQMKGKTEIFVYNQNQRFNRILVNHYTFNGAKKYLSTVSSKTFSVDL